ncbi:vicianin hydrolase-like [Mercurialis annua]|uniref:vicianin hydrolase-like n=1 Tax=Mercurialis annua TaxID=3986 RepID=UPI0021604A63|nr:vicianin hydrolase-like [Mercurialis annua]
MKEMASQCGILLCCLVMFAGLVGSTNGAPPAQLKISFNRTSFPSGFIFGTGSAAYQSEGAAHIDGKGPSIWDNFTHQHPEKIADQSNGDVADDFYHLYKQDIHLMNKIGFDSFRFSISWSRVLPKGKVSGGINPKGVKFYNDLIDYLIARGLIPFVTLFHWDLPQALEDEYNGFRSPNVVDDFRDYVDFVFKTFGDRVKHWCTLNEPYSYSINGYNGGSFAPGRCSKYVGNCAAGDSSTEPYLVAHHLILSHAAAVNLYKTKYQATQKGKIGITIVTNWFLPISPASEADQNATLREVDFMFGWFAHPITYGDYPETMKNLVGNRLPKFTKKESELVKGSLDYLGVNYYTTNFVSNNPVPATANHSWNTDSQTILSVAKAGVLIGTPTALSWLYVYPQGIYHLMVYIKNNYKNPPIFITENGLADANNASLSVEEARKDALRIRYYHSHLTYLLKAIKEGANVKGYYAWCFLDDFEWDAGFTVRFGMIYVDFKDKLKRYMKYSAYWFQMFLLH